MNEKIVDKFKCRLNTLECELQSKTADGANYMMCRASCVGIGHDFGDDIWSVEIKTDSAVLATSYTLIHGKPGIWVKTIPIGKEVTIKKVERKGTPGGYDLIIE